MTFKKAMASIAFTGAVIGAMLVSAPALAFAEDPPSPCGGLGSVTINIGGTPTVVCFPSRCPYSGLVVLLPGGGYMTACLCDFSPGVACEDNDVAVSTSEG